MFRLYQDIQIDERSSYFIDVSPSPTPDDTSDPWFSVTGRMFDYHVLDMIELGIEKFVSLKEVKVKSYKMLQGFVSRHLSGELSL